MTTDKVFIQILIQLFNGLKLGSIYALVALGYNMVYGIISLLNFAHGDIIMVGAYIAWFSMTTLGLHPIISVIIVVLVCVLLGFGIEKVAYAPLRSAPRLSLLITAIGVSYLLENLTQLIVGANGRMVPQIFNVDVFKIGNAEFSTLNFIIIGISIVSMLILNFLVKKTKMGKAMRAVSENLDTAKLMGINPNKIISFTFAIGSALAGIGSILYVSSYSQINPTMGSMLGLKAFVAAVLGGVGSISGAVLGGYIIGLLEIFVSAIGLSVWKDAAVFLALILILIIKPSGILGKPVREKV